MSTLDALHTILPDWIAEACTLLAHSPESSLSQGVPHMNRRNWAAPSEFRRPLSELVAEAGFNADRLQVFIDRFPVSFQESDLGLGTFNGVVTCHRRIFNDVLAPTFMQSEAQR